MRVSSSNPVLANNTQMHGSSQGAKRRRSTCYRLQSRPVHLPLQRPRRQLPRLRWPLRHLWRPNLWLRRAAGVCSCVDRKLLGLVYRFPSCSRTGRAGEIVAAFVTSLRASADPVRPTCSRISDGMGDMARYEAPVDIVRGSTSHGRPPWYGSYQWIVLLMFVSIWGLQREPCKTYPTHLYAIWTWLPGMIHWC